MGPSAASISNSAPSAILSTRSTSPPKSAWPGVSIMLILMPLIFQCNVLGQNRDAALAFQIIAVQDLVTAQLGFAEMAALPQQAIDERGLAVVNMGDNDDVANFVSSDF